jgi:hypothetical protein
MTAKVLTALTAEVVTAAVTIKTMQISRKQVTLAVFRQLITANIVDMDKLALRGMPWGYVNYLIEDVSNDDDDAPVTKPINLVWQTGNELRRCIVKPKAWWRYSEPAGCWVDQHLIRCERGRCPEQARGILDEQYGQLWSSESPHVRREFVNKCMMGQRAEWRENEARADRYDKLVAPLFDLPQLFIAA